MRKPNASTLLGMVLGLMAGLTIAIVIAIVITKMPTPFIHNSMEDSVAVSDISVLKEKEELPVFDELLGLNQPLHTNEGATTEDEKSTGWTADILANTPEKTLLEKIEKGAKKKEEVPNFDRSQSYFLQVGAFRTKSKAENKKANLALSGFETIISKYQKGNALMYRVRIGPFFQLEEMNQARLRLEDNGIDAVILRAVLKGNGITGRSIPNGRSLP